MFIERKQNHMLRITAVSFNIICFPLNDTLNVSNIQCVLIFTPAVIHSS